MTTQTSQACPRCGTLIPEGSAHGLCPRCVLARALAPTVENGFSRHVPPSLEAVGAAFPHLEVLGLIGSGGMGSVFRARQPQLDRCVALKILPTELAAQAGFAGRFQREAQVLARLSHPHIVTIHDFGQAGGFYYLLMEFVDGVNLRQAMQAGRFQPEQALAVVPPVCEALQFAHDRGIVHRDIKPENLLLDKDGRIKIADFGIAKMLGDESNFGLAESQPAGTPQYMAPEQKEQLRTDHRADIYSLGVVLYEMLTGELPAGQLQPPSRKVQIDVRLDAIVLRALEKEPERRYQTAGELRTQVESVVVPGSVPAGVPTGPAIPGKPAEAKPPVVRAGIPWRRLAFGVVVLLVVGFFGLLAFGLWATVESIRRPAARRAAAAQAALHQPIVFFGPVIERTLPCDRGGIEFATGRVVTAPDRSRLATDDALTDWFRQRGMDVMVEEMHRTDGRPNATPFPLVFNLGRSAEERMFVQEGTKAFDALRNGEGATGGSRANFISGPGVWWFQTRGGTRGVMEVLTTTEPRGLKIRYKLLRTAAAGTATAHDAQDPAAALAAWPALEQAEKTLGQMIETKRAADAVAWIDANMLPQADGVLTALTGSSLEQRWRLLHERLQLLRLALAGEDWTSVNTMLYTGNPDTTFRADLEILAHPSGQATPRP